MDPKSHSMPCSVDQLAVNLIDRYGLQFRAWESSCRANGFLSFALFTFWGWSKGRRAALLVRRQAAELLLAKVAAVFGEDLEEGRPSHLPPPRPDCRLQRARPRLQIAAEGGVALLRLPVRSSLFSTWARVAVGTSTMLPLTSLEKLFWSRNSDVY